MKQKYSLMVGKIIVMLFCLHMLSGVASAQDVWIYSFEQGDEIFDEYIMDTTFRHNHEGFCTYEIHC